MLSTIFSRRSSATYGRAPYFIVAVVFLLVLVYKWPLPTPGYVKNLQSQYLGHDPFKSDSEAPTKPVPPPVNVESLLTPEELQASIENNAIEHHEITSSMTKDGNFFWIEFGPLLSYNPNIIPHPYRNDTYIIVAQRDKSHDDNTFWYTEIVCEATFQNGKLKCVTQPMNLPIASTVSSHCHDGLEFINYHVGPHDARIFYGPDAPYALWTAQSGISCAGQYIQDLRRLVDWGHKSPEAKNPPGQPFFFVTELDRPGVRGEIEKNWFLFWDLNGEMYIHYDFNHDHRAFAKVDRNYDGKVGQDLAPETASNDVPCMVKYLPTKRSREFPEGIHQTTNSLSISVCSRADLECQQNPDNTFIFTIIQHKTFYGHGVYEPYVAMFSARPPFALYGMSDKPFWIPGRGRPGGAWTRPIKAGGDPVRDRSWVPKHQSQMLFIVSMNWKTQGLNYHGTLDDEVFITFGVEDGASAGISVRAGDLLSNIGLCSS